MLGQAFLGSKSQYGDYQSIIVWYACMVWDVIAPATHMVVPQQFTKNEDYILNRCPLP
jgi:hypothetical protein